MIDRTCISETFGDCTALYNVYFDKHCTVEEFIHEVLKKYKDEWGYFIVSAIPDSNFFYSSTDCSAQINLAGSQKENRLDVSIRHRFSSSAPDGNDRVAGL